MLCSPLYLSHLLSTVTLGRESGHLELIFVDDLPKPPALLHVHKIPVIAEQMSQLPYLIYTLIRARLEPENGAAGDHVERRRQMLIEPDKYLA